MPNIALYIILGLVAGTFSGVVGLGGGVVIVPALVFLFGMTQHQAQGTTLALLVPPIGILAAYEYYRKGFVDIKIAGLICLGFVAGSIIGARIGTTLPDAVLKKVFGVALLLIGAKMIIWK